MGATRRHYAAALTHKLALVLRGGSALRRGWRWLVGCVDQGLSHDARQRRGHPDAPDNVTDSRIRTGFVRRVRQLERDRYSERAEADRHPVNVDVRVVAHNVTFIAAANPTILVAQSSSAAISSQVQT
jgi:hypothetical protein